MIEPNWKRIAGLHVQDDGTIALAWLALDKDADTLHLYDTALFRREVLAVVTEGILKRGKWVPVSWHEDAKDIAKELLDRGVNTTHEAVRKNPAIAEVTALDIQERMRTSRFKVAKNLTDWLAEFKTYYRQDGVVPKDTHPLMAATRHAVANIDYARGEPKRTSANHPKLAII